MRGVAGFEFVARNDLELSVVKGEVLVVHHRDGLFVNVEVWILCCCIVVVWLWVVGCGLFVCEFILLFILLFHSFIYLFHHQNERGETGYIPLNYMELQPDGLSFSLLSPLPPLPSPFSLPSFPRFFDFLTFSPPFFFFSFLHSSQ